jgi:hypothetical protein
MHDPDARPENRRREPQPPAWPGPDAQAWVRSEAFAEDLDEPGGGPAPRHNPRPDSKGSHGVLEPIRRAAGQHLAAWLGRGLGGARA